jgi:hypothetical protein
MDVRTIPEGEETTEVCVALYRRHVACVERLARQVQDTTGAKLGTSEVVRAFLEALDEAGGINPSLIGGEEDLMDFFLRRLTGQEDRRDDRGRMRS